MIKARTYRNSWEDPSDVTTLTINPSNPLPPAVTVITSLSPSSGTKLGGTTVVILGANFTGTSEVTFDGIDAASFVVDSPTQITAVTPPHQEGAVSVVVVTPGGISAYDSYTYTNKPPSAPTITAPATGFINVLYNFTLKSIDPENDQVRYGVDWNLDGVADEWIPALPGYTSSGARVSTIRSWTTTGTKSFQVLAQDISGENSPWTPGSIILGLPPVIGICGSANGTPTATKPTANLCSQGTPSPITGNGPWSWNCIGSNGGGDDSCAAPVASSCGNGVCEAANGETPSSCRKDCGMVKYREF